MISADAARPPPPALVATLPIETLRALAILVLVSFHVIGGPEAGRGLALSYPHPLRHYADLMIDVRMPVFAFIAGAVYGMRPVAPAQLGVFLTGKLRRLALPGITAITVFLLMATAMHTPEGIIHRPWDAYLRHYGIFWFLQVMLVIFATYGTLDVLTRGRALMPALVLSLVALAAGWRFDSDIMALNRVTHLLAYFLLGMAFMRHLDRVMAHRRPAAAVALVALGLGLGLNLLVLARTGAYSAERLDLQSLLFGTGACVAGMLLLPRLRWLQWLGAFSLTIYLYHILATSMMRRVLAGAGVDLPWVQVLAGTVAGIALPVLLHLVCLRWPVTRLMVLGLRPRDGRRDQPRGASLAAAGRV